MSGTDKDVERAVAAFGNASMTYHTFPEHHRTSDVTTSMTAAGEYPLLSAALPEVAAFPIRQDPPAPVAAATHTQAAPRSAEQTASTGAPARERQEPAPVPGPAENPRSGWGNPFRSSHRTNRTSMDAAFHVLKSGSEPPKQPTVGQPGLQTMLRRL